MSPRLSLSSPDDSPATIPDRTALVLIGLAVLALGVYAFAAHRIGDTAAESDFFGGYAFGARELMHGRVDFGRYGVFGPVYEALVALLALVVRDLFTAARLLSVLSAGAILLAWWAIARRLLGEIAALVLVALLIANPTLGRYGYSATTDGPAFALFSLAAWALVAAPRRGGAVLAGVLAGLATLTRYNLATLLPAGALMLALDVRREGRERVRAIAGFAAGAAIVIAPFTLASLAAGHVPGFTLLRDRGYYEAADPAAVLENRYRDMAAGIGAAPPADAVVPERTWPERFASGLLPHLRDDALLLLGLPATALALAGLTVAFARRRARVFLPLVPLAAFTFLPLAPVYYSLRYTMVLLPLELMPAAWLVGEVARAPWPRPARLAAAWALALAVLAPTARWALASHATWLAELPTESRAAGEAIRAHVRTDGRLLARKAHAAYFARLEPVNFPLVGTLATLGSFCRAQHVDYLYYSGVEARSRPAFAFLLDTTAAVPGLEPIYACDAPPCVVYRVGEEFGATPAWWPDTATRERIAARVNVLLQPGPAVRSLYLALAEDELKRGRARDALRDAEAAERVAPDWPDARRIAAQAHSALGQRDSAVAALREALALEPGDPAARLALGALLHEAGRDSSAAATWRLAIEAAGDARLLATMAAVFDSLGDAASAQRARARLAEVRGRS